LGEVVTAETKEGRVLSTRNLQRIRVALEALQALLAEAEGQSEEPEKSSTPPSQSSEGAASDAPDPERSTERKSDESEAQKSEDEELDPSTVEAIQSVKRMLEELRASVRNE